MGDHFRPGVDNHIDQIEASLKIGNQHLHSDPRALLLETAYQLRPVGGSEVREVVAVDGGYDDMAQSEFADTADDVAYLILIEGDGAPCSDVAETAATRADISADHEGRRAGSPAFSPVGTHSGAADGMEMMFVEQPDDLTRLEAARQLYLQPLGFTPEIGAGSGGFAGGVIFVFHVVRF